MSDPTPSDAFIQAHTTANLEPIIPGVTEVPQPGIDPANRAAIDALPPSSALLIVQHGPNTGARFLLDSDRVTAGRDPKGDIFLDDVTVSRSHAEFVFAQGVHSVRDVGSLNGTYVNRERIDTAQLRSGDEVMIGKYRLIFYPSPNREAGSAVSNP